MKKVLNILLCFVCVIIIILSLAFTFIEARLLLSLDWSIYDNPTNGFIRYLFRLILALFVLTSGLFEIINVFKKEKIDLLLLFTNISLLIMSIIIAIFSTNYVGLVCLGLSILLLIIKLPIFYINRKHVK